MEVLYSHCAGLDVHKKTVVACRIARRLDGKRVIETRTFGTTTSEILQLAQWLEEVGVTDVAMESTGVFWKPVWNILEPLFHLMLVNPQHMKQVPGRKTDVKDAEWIATLLEHGLLRPSFVPPAPQRAVREVSRTRSSLIRQRAEMVNRVQKVLEDANIKLASVATNVLGVSGRAMVEAMVMGETDPSLLASLAVGTMRNKREDLEKALLGRVQAHHRVILAQFLSVIDALDKSIQALDREIEQALAPFTEAVTRLDTITGVGPVTAQTIVSEVGTDLSSFPTAEHFAAWVALAPGNNESAGKRLPGGARKGNQALRSVLVQAAHAAARSRGTYMSSLFHRIAARRGKKRAVVAVAHSILKVAYHMLKRGTEYQDLGADHFDKLRPQRTASRLIQRLEVLGYTVTKAPVAEAAFA